MRLWPNFASSLSPQPCTSSATPPCSSLPRPRMLPPAPPRHLFPHAAVRQRRAGLTGGVRRWKTETVAIAIAPDDAEPIEYKVSIPTVPLCIYV